MFKESGCTIKYAICKLSELYAIYYQNYGHINANQIKSKKLQKAKTNKV